MVTHAPCFERLLVIHDTAALAGAVNMAMDEVLLDQAVDTAILRIYRWAEPTVSFGYFERVADARGFSHGRPAIRRWTGGGIVEHGDDLTYSLCIPRACPFAAHRSVDSYRRIHAAVACALEHSGVPAESNEIPAASPPGGSPGNECFERSVPYDILSGGRKIAGGAQRRTRTGVLHQGSIRVDARELVDLANWKTTLGAALPLALADSYELLPTDNAEFARANALAAAKYATAAWNNRV